MAKPDKAKEIRELRALVPENNLCLNCLSKAPGYVCLTFATFVCTKCAGVHRSLVHAIKSITLSTLTDSEMELMRAGGNANAQKLWLANWSEAEYPRPSSEDESALRKFIKAVYIEERWKLGNGGHSNGHSTSSHMLPMGNGASSFVFDGIASYSAQPATIAQSPPSYHATDAPLQPTTLLPESPAATASSLIPINLPLGDEPRMSHQAPISFGFGNPSTHTGASNPLDLISWEERPAANTMPDQERRQPVYHVQHSSSEVPSQSPTYHVSMSSSPVVQSPPPIVRPGSVNSQPERVGSGSSINVGSPPSEHSRDISAELQIKQLQDMLHAQERQFQHQLQEQQLQQRQLQQQLQHQQIQQQLQQQQLLMGKQQQQSQMLRQAGMTQQGQQTAVRTTGLQGSGYAQMPSGQQAAGAQPIMVLGPNGQLMQLMPQANGGMAMSAQPAASSPMVSTQATAMSQSAAARKPPANAIGFTPIVNAAGQAMMAPPTSPLMTVGHSTPASLPPGSIGPHYIPAPGGGYQAVYMVPSGTLPPGTATNVPGGIAKSTVQKPQHAPMRYGGYPGLATTQPTAAPFVPTGNQEEDDFALAMRLQQEEDARSGGASAGAVPKPQQRVPAARPASAGPPDAYFQDSYLANASYIANDEELARQLAAADLSDEE